MGHVPGVTGHGVGTCPRQAQCSWDHAGNNNQVANDDPFERAIEARAKSVNNGTQANIDSGCIQLAHKGPDGHNRQRHPFVHAAGSVSEWLR